MIQQQRQHLGLVSALAMTAALLAVAASAPAATVAYWRFDNDGKTAGQTVETALDETANDNDGSGAPGASLPTYSSDVFGSTVPQTGAANGLSLDMERDDLNRVRVNDTNNTLDFGDSSFTIEAYVKFETLVNTADFFSQQFLVWKKQFDSPGASDTQVDYGVVFASSGRFGSTANGTLVLVQGDGSSANNTVSGLRITDTADWHYISVAFDAPNDLVRFIIDDQTATIAYNSAFAAVANNEELIIGAHKNAVNNIDALFDGKIDELRISSGFLDTSELLNAAAIPAPAALPMGLAMLTLMAMRRRGGNA